MPDPILEMSKEAAETRNIENDDWVEVSTAVGVFVAKAKVIRDIEPASVFAQHGWWVIGANKTPYGPDNPMAANMNRTIATDLRDPISGSIPIRSSYCNVEKMSIDDHGKQSKRP
jgi:anaerobic selenocysteine-containing dehydrogenase